MPRDWEGRGEAAMDNVWERLVQLQLRQMGAIAHRRSFCKYNHRASDASFEDLCRDDSNWPATKMSYRLKEPSVLDGREGSDGKHQHPALDPEIWKKLPENLMEAVFLHLPLHSVLRLRAVCRRWNALLHCPSFLESWQRGPTVAGESPWLIFRGSSRECVAYNPNLDRWSKVAMEFLPSSRVRVVASAGGLLAVRRRDDSLMVINPFTKSHVHLPPKLCKWKYPVVGMVADRKCGKTYYRVVVAGSPGIPAPHMTTEVYDSIGRNWKLVGSKPVRHHFQTNAVHYRGFLYSAGFSVIMVYDLANDAWSEMHGPPVTQHTNLIMPQICECRGRLLMVEVVSERFLMRRVSIWAKDLGTGSASASDISNAAALASREWAMLDTMPDTLLGEVVAMSNSRFFSYFGHDDLLCFVIARREILAYTVSQKCWRWLPSCPFVQGFAQRFAAFAFHPTLNACE